LSFFYNIEEAKEVNATNKIKQIRPGSFNILFIVLPHLAAGQNLMKIKNKNDYKYILKLINGNKAPIKIKRKL
jgi:hypothetical protein